MISIKLRITSTLLFSKDELPLSYQNINQDDSDTNSMEHTTNS